MRFLRHDFRRRICESENDGVGSHCSDVIGIQQAAPAYAYEYVRACQDFLEASRFVGGIAVFEDCLLHHT